MAGSLKNWFASLKPDNAKICAKVFRYCARLTSGLFMPACCKICSCFCKMVVRTATLLSSVPPPSATFTTTSIFASQPRGSTGTNFPRSLTIRFGRWFWIANRSKPPNKRFMPVSAKIRAINSMRCCAAVTVAATAALVEDCSESAAKPAAALVIPVRFSRISSI